MERYTDKIVMITGAGDVALAIAERMLGEGARIAFTDFSETALTAAVNEMTASGFGEDRVMTVQCDVRSQDACDAAVTAITARWSRIDTMVATAGIIRHLPIDQMSEKDWQDVIDINLSGVFRLQGSRSRYERKTVRPYCHHFLHRRPHRPQCGRKLCCKQGRSQWNCHESGLLPGPMEYYGKHGRSRPSERTDVFLHAPGTAGQPGCRDSAGTCGRAE